MKKTSKILALTLTLIMAVSLLSVSVMAEPAIPQVEAVAVAPNQEAPLKTVAKLTSNNPADVLGKVALGCEYVFTPGTISQDQRDYYGNWYCDYAVTFSQDVAANSFGLYGKFSYGTDDYEAAFYFPNDVAANTPVYLLRSANLENITFNDVLTIGTFDCGAFNAAGENVLSTMTVKLVMWNGNEDPTAPGVSVSEVERETYTFTAPAIPTATVTEIADPNQAAPVKTDLAAGSAVGTVALGCEYKFEADDPADNTLEYYKDWNCDFEVTFDEAVAANSLGLYGKFSFGTDDYEGAFYFPATAAGTPVRLLETAGLNSITYQDVLTIGTFYCGAFNVSGDNLTNGMDVKLVLWKGAETPVTVTLENDAGVPFTDGKVSYDFEVPPMPTADVTETIPASTNVPLYDISVSYTNPTGKVVNLSSEYKFSADTPADNTLAYYGDWNCDFEVTFNEALAANSFGLWGAYDVYSVGFVVDQDVAAGTTYKLLGDLFAMTRTYNEIYNEVNLFKCGVFNLSDTNLGHVMTVKLVLWKDGEEATTKTQVAVEDYTFNDVQTIVDAYPEAIVTEVTPLPTDVAVYMTKEKVFASVDPQIVYNFVPADNSKKGTDRYNKYKDWYCDFVISFNQDIAKESLGLYGKYAGYNVALLIPVDLTAGDEYYLLSGLGLDAHLTYREVVENVISFDCGAFNLSDANQGATLTVKLNMFQLDGTGNRINEVTIGSNEGSSQEYTIPAKTELKVTVALTSQDTAGNPSVAPLIGGCITTAGTEVTVTASLPVGYDFIGWYKDSYTGTPVSTSTSYTFNANENTNLVAVYAAKGDFTLKITGTAFELEGTAYSDALTTTKAAGSYTVEYKGTDAFLYWVNESNNIVSTEASYIFRIVSNTELKAVSVADNSAAVKVVYLNSYNQVISSRTVATEAEFSAFAPAYTPSKMGSTFNKWVIKGSGEDATAANVMAHAGETVLIVPTFDKDSGTYTVNVYPVTKGGAEGDYESYSKNIGETLTINSADLTPAGDAFLFWSLDGTTAVSYDTTYTAVYGTAANVKLYAVYGTAAEDAVATASIVQMYAKDLKISTTMKAYVPTGCTVIEAGFVYGTSTTRFGSMTPAELASAIVIDAEKTYKHLSGLTGNTVTYTFHGAVTKTTTTLYIRAFVTYTDGTNTVTVYSDVRSGSCDSLNN